MLILKGFAVDAEAAVVVEVECVSVSVRGACWLWPGRAAGPDSHRSKTGHYMLNEFCAPPTAHNSTQWMFLR